MDSEDQRTVEELIARYQLEPTLRDVYVEGLSDKRILEWFLDEAGFKDVVLYEIDTVNIPSAELHSRNIENNKRGRVMYLAQMAELLLGVNSLQVTGIADADLDRLLDRLRIISTLVYTDYTSMEMYLFEESALVNLATILLGQRNFPARSLLSQFSPILKELFLTRAANDVLGWNLEGVDFERSLKIRSGTIVFDIEDYITRYLNKNARHRFAQEFRSKRQELRRALALEDRHLMHGHDYVDLLAWYIKQVNKKMAPVAAEVLSRGIYMCINRTLFASSSLFASLKQRLQTTAIAG